MSIPAKLTVGIFFALIGVFFYWVIFAFSFAERTQHGIIIERINDLMVSPGVNRVDLDILAGHPVERVCAYYGTAGFVGVPIVRAVAEFGLAMDIDAEAKIPERHYAVFLIGPNGEVTYGALSDKRFDPFGQCSTGTHLALQFDTIDPLAGGRIVDLDAPDLYPTLIE